MMNSVERLHEMTMTRELAARADAVSEEERTAELTFSSENPYKRWFGLEILDHSENSVDLTRLQEIGVLLFNHEPDHPIGKVEKVWIGDDSRGIYGSSARKHFHFALCVYGRTGCNSVPRIRRLQRADKRN